MFGKLCFSFLVLTVLGSCGLKYVPTETPEQFEARRHSAIENFIRTSLNSDSSFYNSEAFGEITVVKPESYKFLDSLFELKYEQEQKGITNKELNEQIESQKLKIELDTNRLYYLEEHVFSLKRKDSSEFIISKVLLDKKMNVERFEVENIIEIPNKCRTYYKQYLFNESFIYPGIQATEEENRFYNFYREGIGSTSNSEGDEILSRMLQVMDLAYKKKTLQTTEILKYLARTKINGTTKELEKESVLNIYQLQDDNNAPVGYWFVVEFKQGSNIVSWYFEYDLYLREMKAVRTDQ